MALTANHYDLLGIGIDATTEEIAEAYRAKTEKFTNEYMHENYKTAYYVLSDPCRREQYDISLGLHKYRRVPGLLKVLKAAARVLLTTTDALLSFYWCALAVVFIYGIISVLQCCHSSHMEFIAAAMKIWYRNQDLITVLTGFALIDMVLHFYIRRTNRLLKHFKWEYKIKADKD